MAENRFKKALFTFFFAFSLLLIIHQAVPLLCSSYRQDPLFTLQYDKAPDSQAAINLTLHSNFYCPETEDIEAILLSHQNSQSRWQGTANHFPLQVPKNGLPYTMIGLISDEIFVHLGSTATACYLHKKDGMI